MNRSAEANRDRGGLLHSQQQSVRKRIVVILGMHRSGTSALTRGVQVLGAALGDRLMAGRAGDNDKGFFEDLDIYRLNETLLRRCGTSWRGLEPLDGAAFAGEAFADLRAKAADLLARKLDGLDGPFAVKDPRLCLLMPFWRAVCGDLGVSCDYVVALRHPADVARSLEKRNGAAIPVGLALWTRYTLGALEASRFGRRTFVLYDALLDDPGGQLRRISDALSLPLPDDFSDGAKLYREDFLDPGLRTARSDDRESLYAYFPQGFDLFEALLPCAQGASSDAPKEAQQRAEAALNAALPLLARLDDVHTALGETTEKLASAEQQNAALQEKNERLEEARQAAVDGLLAHEEKHVKEAKIARAVTLRAQKAQALHAAAHGGGQTARPEASSARKDDAEAIAERNEAIARQADLAAALASAQAELSTMTQALMLAKERAAEGRARETQRQTSVQTLEAALAAQDARLQETLGLLSAQQAELVALRKALDEKHALIDGHVDRERRRERDVAQALAALAEERSRIDALNAERARSDTALSKALRDKSVARHKVVSLRRSTSWRVTAPLRAVSRTVRRSSDFVRRTGWGLARIAWRALPISSERRGRIAGAIFRTAPGLARRYHAYRNRRADRPREDGDGAR